MTPKGYTDTTALLVKSHFSADYQFSSKVMFSESEVFKLHTKNKKKKSPPFFFYFLCRNTDFSKPVSADELGVPFCSFGIDAENRGKTTKKVQNSVAKRWHVWGLKKH